MVRNLTNSLVRPRRLVMRRNLVFILLMVVAASSPTFAQTAGEETTWHSTEKGKAWDDLEKELGQLDQKWLSDLRNKNIDVLRDLWTDQFFEINRGGTVVDKDYALANLSKLPVKPGFGAFPSDFKLRAVYGDFALATDRTTINGGQGTGWAVYNGHDFSGDYRTLRMFVKMNGTWKVAGATLSPIITGTPQETAAPAAVTYFDHAEVDANFAKTIGNLFTGQSGNAAYRIVTGHRDHPGEVEIHELDTDIIYVITGTATFVTGGAAIEPKATAPNEIRGTSIEGGVTHQLNKGDVIIIPHGVPHWFKDVQPPFQYLVVKVR